MAFKRPPFFSGQAPALDSLAFRLAGAAEATRLVCAGKSLPDALVAACQTLKTDNSSRAAIQDIAYNTMRKLGTARFLTSSLVKKSIETDIVKYLLFCALALLIPDGSVPRYSPFTVVNQAVTAANTIRHAQKAKGLINAVLRNYLRTQEVLLEKVASNDEAKWNYPQWWIDNVKTHYPNQWQSILEAGNRTPPLTLRVNTRRISPEDYLKHLQQAHISADIIGPYAVRLASPIPVDRIPGFQEGLVSVQDKAAQLAAPLLGLKDGMQVLDACAAPGGKSAHMLELADIALTALDSGKKRLSMIHENLDRLGLHARVLHGDATQSDWWDGTLYDCILADVPCSASGVIRRHPDIRWLRKPEDAQQLASYAKSILDNLWVKLKPGGKFLLATCSIWPEESEEQAVFFAFKPDAHRLDASGQLLPSFNGLNDHDGLFYALFRKSI